MIGELLLPGIEGRTLDPGDIWSVVILGSVNQTSVRKVCAENHKTPCDDTAFEWLHTLDRGWLEFAANLLCMQLVMTILDRSGLRIVSTDFVDNPIMAFISTTKANSVRWLPKTAPLPATDTTSLTSFRTGNLSRSR